MMFRFILLQIAMLALMPVAQAEEGSGLFVEPGVTYEMKGEGKVNYAGAATSDAEANGFGLMARLGFHLGEIFFVGADGRFQKLKFEDRNSIFNYDADADGYNWGPVVGIQMPDFGLRIWGNYIVGGGIDPESSGAFDLRFKKATGYRVGAGLRLAAVSLNLEYQDLNYGETEGSGPFAPGTVFDDVELDNKSWIVSLSFPLEI